MDKLKCSNKHLVYAAILMISAFSILSIGFFVFFKPSAKLIDPITGFVSPSNSKDTVSVTPSDGAEVIPDEAEGNVKDNNEAISDLDGQPTNSSNDNNGTNAEKSNKNRNNDSQEDPLPPTIAETNHQLRKQIENNYGVTIFYGSETGGYSINAGGTTISTTPISNDVTAQSALYALQSTLSQYPRGLFQEIKDGGIPLTILLVNNYSDNTVTGVTDSDYSRAVISIAVSYPFAESFYHESYHYIERYLFKLGANFNTWDAFNPDNFTWGNVYNDYSYSNTFSPSAPFVNNYAQTAPEEDRASTFEYMMADSKASCLNYGNTVWRKADQMAKTIETVLNSVKPNVIERWERHLT